jgi:sugar phosphate isomerase/epimerase
VSHGWLPGSITVFTKPWPGLALGQLAEHVRTLGFDGVELPVRPGFQVSLDDVSRALPEAAKTFAGEGLRISSVAADPTPAVISACGETGVPIIRVCIDIPDGEDYLETESAVRRRFDGIVGQLAEHGVRLGVQNHYGSYVSNAMGIRHLIEGYDPAVIGAVWDGAHCGLDGELPRLAVAILWSHLCLVNLKNARWRRKGVKTRHLAARFEAEFVKGPDGLCPWADVLAELRGRGYGGDLCMTAEYTDYARTDDYLKSDRSFLASLLQEKAP